MEAIGQDQSWDQQRDDRQQGLEPAGQPASGPGIFQEKAADGGGIGQLEAGLDLDPEDFGRHIHRSELHHRAGCP